MEKYTNNHKIAIASVFMVFFIDLLTPLDYVDGVFYMFTFVLLRGASRKLIYSLLTLSIFCNFLIVFLHFDDNLTKEIVINRGISVLAVILSAFWTLWDKNHIEKKHQIKEDFNSEIKAKDEQFKIMYDSFFILIENMFEGAQLIDKDHKFIYVNKAFEFQSQFKRDELLGYSMEEKFPQLVNSELIKLIDKVMDTNIQMSHVFDFEKPNKSISTHELFLYPVKEGLFILSFDLTERMNADKLKKEYTQQLEQMLHITSHKVRQPVSNLIGIMHQLVETDVPEDDKDQLYAFMKLSCLRLEVFIKELNDFLQKAKINSEN
jgi:PAS domain-containing protein